MCPTRRTGARASGWLLRARCEALARCDPCPSVEPDATARIYQMSAAESPETRDGLATRVGGRRGW